MTSLRRTCVPFIRYSFCPSRCTTRSMTTSLKSISRRRSELSNTTFTTPRLARGKAGEPPQIKSSPRFERSDFIDCSPKTNRNPSATFDLPEPFGPTTATIGEPNTSSVFFPKDLNPESSMDFRYICIQLYQKKRTLGQRSRVLLPVPGQTSGDFANAHLNQSAASGMPARTTISPGRGAWVDNEDCASASQR